MKNSTRYLLSHLATRLGIAAFYSSMHLHPAGCEMPPEQKRTPAACVSSIHLEPRKVSCHKGYGRMAMRWERRF